MKTLGEKLRSLPKARRARITARAAELEAEELSLRALRQARKLTQERIAETLGVAQENVSRLEKRNDVLLSTLTQYVEAVGGRLRLMVDFPDRSEIQLAGPTIQPGRRARSPARKKRRS